MRRLLGLLLLLATLTVTTAVAASFEVTAEDIGSFSPPVSIDVPTTSETYLMLGEVRQMPGLLANVDEVPDGTSTRNKGIQADPTTPIDGHTDTGKYHDWETPPLEDALTIISPVVKMFIDQPGGGNTITAGLFDCTTTTMLVEEQRVVLSRSCSVFAEADSDPDYEPPDGVSDNEQMIPFGPFTRTIPATSTVPATDTEPEKKIERSLLLRIVNQQTNGQFNIQWGYKDNRAARLEMTVPAP